jgi:CheY-like chemotaxis protein
MPRPSTTRGPWSQSGAIVSELFDEIARSFLDGVPRMRAQIRETIYRRDAQVAHDSQQAIEYARRRRPHYVLLDLALPGLDGY